MSSKYLFVTQIVNYGFLQFHDIPQMAPVQEPHFVAHFLVMRIFVGHILLQWKILFFRSTPALNKEGMASTS